MQLQNTAPLIFKDWGTRHILAWMGFWSFAVNHAMRFNISLAIVVMVKPFDRLKERNNVLDSCADVRNLSSEVVDGGFDWTEADQGLILGSFFWGFTITQLPGGMLSDRFGGKWVMGLSLLLTAILTFAIPHAAHMGMYFLVAIRILQGLAEGVTTPALQVLLSNWLPPNERSRLGTITYSGVAAGSAVTMISGGYLIENFGWPSLFYATGGVSVIWFIFWCFFVFESPAVHPRIDKEEAEYLQRVIAHCKPKNIAPSPWSHILRSTPIWAIFIAQVTYIWGLSTLQMLLPTYMSTVLNFGIELNSWLSATPHLCMWAFGMIVPYLADIVLDHNLASVITMRKACNSISFVGAALAFIATAIAGCNWLFAVISLNLALGLLGVAFGGYIVNFIDVVPNHSGVIKGLTNTVSNLCGFGAPYVAGRLASVDPSWQSVFWLAAVVMLFGNTAFVLFASGNILPWNMPLLNEEETPEGIVQIIAIPCLSDLDKNLVGYLSKLPEITVSDLSVSRRTSIVELSQEHLNSLTDLSSSQFLSTLDLSRAQRLSLPELSQTQYICVPEMPQAHRLSSPQLSQLQSQQLLLHNIPGRRYSGISEAIYLA